MTLTLVALALAAGGAAAPPPLPPLDDTRPLTLLHPRPEGLELAPAAENRWTVAVSAAAGNTFTATHQVWRAHAAVDPTGSRLSPEARAFAALHWPEDVVFHLDGEVQTLALEAAGPLGGAWFGGARVSTWRLGDGGLDGLPEWWHDLLGLNDAGRPAYPRGATQLWLRAPGREALVEAPLGPKLGPAALWGGRALPPLGRLAHRVWAVAVLPGEDAGDLGNGGGSWGLRWAGEVDLGRRLAVHGGLGYTVLGGETVWAEPAADTAHGWLGLALDLGRGWGVSGLVRADGSPSADAVSGRLAEPGGELAVAVTRRLNARSAVQVGLSEDVPWTGISPDFGLQLRLLVTP